MLASLVPPVGTAAAVEETVISPVEQVKIDLARGLREAAREPEVRRALAEALAGDAVADPRTMFVGLDSLAGERFSQQAIQADAWLKDFLGLSAMTDAAFAVYVADVDGRLERGVAPWFAAGLGDDQAATTLIADDLDGVQHTVDLNQAPPVPLIMVDLHMDNITPQAMRAFSASLRAEGVQSDFLIPTDQTPPAPQDPVTRLDRIKLDDDHEPGGDTWYCRWFISDECRAEIFVLAMGGSNGQPRVDVVSLHTVDYSGKTYFPNRNIVHWQRFSWDKVDLLVMEEDPTLCSLSPAKYGKIVARAIIPLAGNAAYVPLNTAARNAMDQREEICDVPWPLSLGVNVPDYVDSFNAVSKATVGTQVGVLNNADTTMSLN
ncbi:DUF3103 family protein [Phytohabitans aurantiacus]|uniref:DUF3103 family protein n=1 Tax=Phytohabitans aurantiacus TaxID=3016789 RepID=UPI0024929AE0|nr:DUF3103 family protein [Phytohabitans aurantiacus]